MKKLITLLVMIAACTTPVFAPPSGQPPLPVGKTPDQGLTPGTPPNDPNTTPIGTSTMLLVTLGLGYVAFKVQSSRSKSQKEKA